MYNHVDRYSEEYRTLQRKKERVARAKALQRAIELKKCEDIAHYYQHTNTSCGPASIRMVLKCFGVESFEEQISKEIGRRLDTGTPNVKLIKIKDVYNLQCEYGDNGSIERLSELTNNGWRCIVHYSLPDVTHYAVFLYDNGSGHVVLNDPWFGPHFCLRKTKFLKMWKAHSRYFESYDYRAPATIRWFAAFKARNREESDENNTEISSAKICHNPKYDLFCQHFHDLR